MPERCEAARPRLLVTAAAARAGESSVPALERVFEVTVLAAGVNPVSPLCDGFDAVCAALDESLQPAADAPWLTTRPRPTPLVVLGDGEPERERAALEAGAWDVLPCHAPPASAVARIARAVEHGRALRRQADEIERLASLTMTDEVTGLHNQRYLRAHLEASFACAQRYDHALAIIALDIDHFKEVNDSCDHLFGTFILAELGRLLNGALRKADILCRFGGDEFFAVLPHIGLESAMMAAERIRKLVSQHQFTSPPWTLAITASFGVSSWPEHDAESGEELLRLADAALYSAKRAGRNRCVAASVDPAVIGV